MFLKSKICYSPSIEAGSPFEDLPKKMNEPTTNRRAADYLTYDET